MASTAYRVPQPYKPEGQGGKEEAPALCFASILTADDFNRPHGNLTLKLQSLKDPRMHEISLLIDDHGSRGPFLLYRTDFSE